MKCKLLNTSGQPVGVAKIESGTQPQAIQWEGKLYAPLADQTNTNFLSYQEIEVEVIDSAHFEQYDETRAGQRESVS
jgi:hypothetical protein